MTTCPLEPLAEAALPAGFCAFALPVEVSQVRTVVAVSGTALLILERSQNAIVLLQDTDGDGVADTRRVLALAPRLNHGLALHNGYLYASSDTTVYRWSYRSSSSSSSDSDDESFTDISAQPEIVINNINANGQGGAPFGHTTRTLTFDKAGRLYVSVGSAGNVDQDSFRSRIRRFDLPSGTDAFPIDFLTGEVFADGLRNEVGLAWDRHGILWGVENGADNLQRQDLGGDITNDNPAEEMHRFAHNEGSSSSPHYGYPYCWTEYLLPPEYGLGRGTVWAWPGVTRNGVAVTDTDCRENYATAEVAMQAHSAPLGITFYQYNDNLPDECNSNSTGGAFPPSMDGYAFIAFHGSWNRDIPTGYKVVYVAMDENGHAAGQPVDLLAHAGTNARWRDGFRPVDVDFDVCGRLLVTSDGTRNQGYGGSKVVRIEYHGESPVQSQVPSNSPSPSGESEPLYSSSPTVSHL